MAAANCCLAVGRLLGRVPNASAWDRSRVKMWSFRVLSLRHSDEVSVKLNGVFINFKDLFFPEVNVVEVSQ